MPCCPVLLNTLNQPPPGSDVTVNSSPTLKESSSGAAASKLYIALTLRTGGFTRGEGGFPRGEGGRAPVGDDTIILGCVGVVSIVMDGGISCGITLVAFPILSWNLSKPGISIGCTGPIDLMACSKCEMWEIVLEKNSNSCCVIAKSHVGISSSFFFSDVMY